MLTPPTAGPLAGPLSEELSGPSDGGLAPPPDHTPSGSAEKGLEKPRRQAPGRMRRFVARRPWTPWLYLAPALILFALFKFVPMGLALKMSVFEVRPFLGDIFVGMDNYREVLTDPLYADAIWHTIVLAVGTTVGALVLGLIMALVLEGQARHLWFIRSAVFLPVVVAVAVVAEVWRIMLYPSSEGVVNTLLSFVGAGPSPFLTSPDTALGSVMAVGIWKAAPYDMMIFLAGLASIDRTLYEASAVDGASTWRRIWHVTLPGLRPVISILVTLAAIRGLRVFTEVFLLTNGGPAGSTEVLMTRIFKTGLEDHELGVAAAGSVIMVGAIVILTLLARLNRKGVS